MIAKAIIQTTLILLMACLCAWGGYRITRTTSKAWLVCFLSAFSFVMLVVALHRIPNIAYHPLFVWLASANEFIVMATCVPFIFALLIPRLRLRRQKIFLSIFAALMTVYFVVPPVLDPALLYASMADSDTWLEGDVCLQTTSYTCGAASAVTALKQFGIDAEEKDMAYAAATSRVWGTPVYTLAHAIETACSEKRIACSIRTFNSIDELSDCCPVIVVVKYRPLVDHYVTVLEIGNDFVLVGDPLKGKERLTYPVFSQKWRKIGIVVSRKQEVSNEL